MQDVESDMYCSQIIDATERHPIYLFWKHLLRPLMSSSSPNRKSADGPKDDFKHNLAIKLSRALNTVNPNDLLAQRVTDLAQQNDLEGFSTGIANVGVPGSVY